MRETWELPGLSGKKRMIRAALVVGLVWPLVVLPVVGWMVLRPKPVPPPPPDRELSIGEQLAAVMASNRLSAGYATLKHQVTTPVARFDVIETAQGTTGDSIGTVTSGRESGQLLSAGGQVYFRGSSAFWSTIGVPTAFTGWVSVGNQLGAIPFPLAKAAAGLLPGRQSRIDTVNPSPNVAVYRNGDVTAQLTAQGVIGLSVGDRSAQTSASGDVAGVLASAIAEAGASSGTLNGVSGALTVSEPAQPPKPEPTH